MSQPIISISGIRGIPGESLLPPDIVTFTETCVRYCSGGPIVIGGTILATSLAGAGFGALMSSMIGSSIGNRQINQFSAAIDKGEFLMMVDVPKQRIEEIEQVVNRNHPETSCRGTEPTIPAFP